MRTATHRSVGQTLTDDEGREFELPIADMMGDPAWSAEISDLPDGRVLVSYLVVDEDAQHLDPREDCNGWQEFIVLDNQSDADELSSMLNDCTACGYHRSDHSAESNGGHDPLQWIGCDEFVQSDARVALDAGRAFLFEKYEHGLVRYALRGESSQVDRQWDVSPVAGFMWADDDWGPDVDIEEMARGFLETFTSWCNSDVYGIVHAWFTDQHGTGWTQDDDDENTESCWGFIGHDYAEAELKAEHANYAGSNA